MASPVTIAPADAGQRLDRWLKRVCSGVPFIGVQKAIRTGRVKVNGRKVAMDFRLQARDVVTFPNDFMAEPRAGGQGAYVASAADKEMLRQAIVHEDAQLLVLNKPQGLPAQAGGGQVRSLDRLLAAVYGAEKTPKLVHRLDRETTGLIVCAKNRTTAAALGAQWADRQVVKAYLALVVGEGLPPRGEFTFPIAKAAAKAVIDPSGDPATTRWVRLGRVAALPDGRPVWAVLAWPKTGRMNQIRVHFAHAGWPLVGDDKYDIPGGKLSGKQLATGLALHAWRLQVQHPATGKPLALQAALPAVLQRLLPDGSAALGEAERAWHDWVK